MEQAAWRQAFKQIYFSIFKIFFSECVCEQGGGAEGEGECQAGLHLMTPRSRSDPKSRVGHLTKRATQVPCR